MKKLYATLAFMAMSPLYASIMDNDAPNNHAAVQSQGIEERRDEVIQSAKDKIRHWENIKIRALNLLKTDRFKALNQEKKEEYKGYINTLTLNQNIIRCMWRDAKENPFFNGVFEKDLISRDIKNGLHGQGMETARDFFALVKNGFYQLSQEDILKFANYPHYTCFMTCDDLAQMVESQCAGMDGAEEAVHALYTRATKLIDEGDNAGYLVGIYHKLAHLHGKGLYGFEGDTDTAIKFWDKAIYDAVCMAKPTLEEIETYVATEAGLEFSEPRTLLESAVFFSDESNPYYAPNVAVTFYDAVMGQIETLMAMDDTEMQGCLESIIDLYDFVIHISEGRLGTEKYQDRLIDLLRFFAKAGHYDASKRLEGATRRIKPAKRGRDFTVSQPEAKR